MANLTSFVLYFDKSWHVDMHITLKLSFYILSSPRPYNYYRYETKSGDGVQ